YRAVTEDGDRITLDNDPTNVITFDPTKNLWHFSYTTNPEYKNVWIVAASCATAVPSMALFPTRPGAMSSTSLLECCNTPFSRLHSIVLVSLSPFQISIRCRAGLWVFHWRDSDGWSLKNASC
ncbi:hypothetical protein PENTCL1PPCAC_16039, partial [Pristionchus entomophagus]